MGTLRDHPRWSFLAAVLAVAARLAAGCTDPAPGAAGDLPGDRGGTDPAPARTDGGRDARTDREDTSAAAVEDADGQSD